MDISFFFDAVFEGSIPLLLVVFMLVQGLKTLKNKDGGQLIDGNGLLIASFGIGLILGLVYTVYAVQPPAGTDWYTDYRYWVGAAVYGIALGGLASLFFESIKAIVTKAFEIFEKRGVDQSGQE